MNDSYLHNLTTNELLRHVDRNHPEVKELAERLDQYHTALLGIEEKIDQAEL